MSLCYDFEKWTMITLAMVAGSLTIGLLMQYANGQTTNINNTDFSISVLDNWAYRQPNPLANIFGAGSRVGLIPTEFSNLLVNTSEEVSGKSILNGGAFSILSLDTDYPYRNIPLETYTQYNIHLSPVKIFSQENTTIDGEKAIKIHRTARNNLTNVEALDYYVVHDGKPYTLQYAANVRISQNIYHNSSKW